MKAIMNIKTLERIVITTSVMILSNMVLHAQPVSSGNADIEQAYARLENLMRAIEQSARYEVPDENIVEAFQHLEWLVTETKMDIQYKAPDNVNDWNGDDDDEHTSGKRKEPLMARRAPVRVEATGFTMQETWLINAGYYKSVKSSAGRSQKHLASK